MTVALQIPNEPVITVGIHMLLTLMWLVFTLQYFSGPVSILVNKQDICFVVQGVPKNVNSSALKSNELTNYKLVER